MIDLLNSVARQTQDFSHATGLHCKDGCGKCCENPQIETTVAEMMPLARHLWAAGEARQMWDRLVPGPCVFYKPDAAVAGNGRCSVYEYRPGICRLFGFAARRGKDGRKELFTCRVMKEHFSEDCRRAQDHIDSGRPVPMASDYGLQVQSADPNWGRELMPINSAVRLALERVHLSPGAAQ